MSDVKQFASDKILQHLDVLKKWKEGKNPYAITTEIDPTNICNHRCLGCAGWLGRKNTASLNIEEMRKCLSEIKDLGGKAVTFTGGGEPLMNRSTPAAIDYARYIGLDVGLVINGTYIKNSSPHTLLNACTWIRISLDAGSQRIHERTHGTKDYAAVLDNICLLVKLKKEAKHDCTIGVGYLTGCYTDAYSDMMDFVNLAIKLEVDYAQFRPYHTAANKDLSRFNRPIDFKPFVAKSNEKTKILYSKHKYDCIATGRLTPEYDICYGQGFAAVITATGDMTICCHTRGIDKFTIGNIKRESIRDIWMGLQRLKAISKIEVSQCPAICRANTFNYILWEMRREKPHVNFL